MSVVFHRHGGFDWIRSELCPFCKLEKTGAEVEHWIKEFEEARWEVERLRQVIRDAPHAEGCPCDGMPSHWTLNKNSDEPCDCWKRDALG